MPSPYEHRTVGNVADESTRRYNAAVHRIEDLESQVAAFEQERVHWRTARDALLARLAEREAQVRWLRDYAIIKTIEAHQLKFGEIPTRHEIGFITGAIDGNMAIAADRAKGNVDDHD
jgi:hypothetical protein